MGTNYYVERGQKCQSCGHNPEEPLHIGKSSAGWEFCFAPYPEHGLTSWQAWRAYLTSGARRIYDEYGSDATLSDLEAEIASKRGKWTHLTAPRHAWGPWPREDHGHLDPEGYYFSTTADFS